MQANDVVFYSPFQRFSNIDDMLIYIRLKFFLKKECVQINLDNCTIQRMEKLSQESTIEDVKSLGLYPLYIILNKSPNIFLCPFGIHEMPGINISKARESYELFCKKFWPTHIDDPRATSLKYDKNQTTVNFQHLSEEEKYVYGPWYLAYLLIQKIMRCNKNDSAVDKFSRYIHDVIYYLDMISAFELEIAKYAFWDIPEKELHNLPSEIIYRRKNFKKNFISSGKNLERIKRICLNAAMDTLWLKGCQAKSTLDAPEDLGNGYKLTETWLATTDEKLYKSSNDIESIPTKNGFGYFVKVFREKEMKKYEYWNIVDSISDGILIQRSLSNKNNFSSKMNNISNSINEIEGELKEYFDAIPA